MTREEEIKSVAEKESVIFYKFNSNCGDCYEGGFIDGAKWADETMIDKACEWLSKTLYIHKEEIEDKHWNMTETFEWVTSDYDSVRDFINGFKKAMKGE